MLWMAIWNCAQRGTVNVAARVCQKFYKGKLQNNDPGENRSIYG
jgi:hypothetical protein